MKILKLKSKNINSLKGEFSIDFTSFLNNNALFAITGPTGAGKSTILDIITCALYGRTPRLKNPNDLMARHTGECYCEVEFEIKGIVYRSSWTQKRARKNATGKFQSAKMELSNVDTQKVIKSTLRDVPKYIEELSGLDFDRFKQSMMLAQGSFDAFLKAKESDRSALLEKITGTQIYNQISQEIYQTYTANKVEIDTDKKILETTELLTSTEIDEKTNILEENKKNKKTLDIESKKLIEIKTWIETLEKLTLEDTNYSELYRQSLQEKEDNKHQFNSLFLGNKALNIQSTYQEYNNIVSIIILQKEKLIKLDDESKVFKSQLESTNTLIENIKKEYEKEKSSFELNSIKLKNIRVFKEQINSKSKLKIDIENKILQYKKELAQFFNVELSVLLENDNQINAVYTQQKDKIKSSYDNLTYSEKEYLKIESELSQKSQNENTCRNSLNTIEQLKNTIIDYESLTTNIINEKKFYQELIQQIELDTILKIEKIKLIEQIQLSLDTLMQKRENELLIAKYEDDRKKLQNNEECFLCGSTNHPYIENSVDIDIDETSSKIQTQKSLFQNESNYLKTYEDKILLNTKKVEDSLLELENLNNTKESIEQFFRDSDFTLASDSQILLKEQKEILEKEILEINVLRENKDIKQKEKERLQKEYHLLQERDIQIKSIIKVYEENKEELISLQTEMASLKQKSKKILDIEDIDVFEKKITDKYTQTQSKYNETSKDSLMLKTKLESLNTQLKELLKKQENDELDLDKLEIKFNKALIENDFSTKKEFEDSLLSKEKREELSFLCKNIEDRYTKYKTLQIDTAKKLKEHKSKEIKIRPLDEVVEELQELNKKIDEVQKTIGSSEKELEINTQNRKKNEEKIKELENKKEKFKVWVKLNEMIGSADGNRFAKFAQGITLDQLINLANQHLTLLSTRYELQRSSDSKQLLEIEVCDSFQGDVVRPASTLSGGESFIVSLSLALGLSELASQKISIDSLFLDEGFGTLDENSLETALNALNLLQSRGKMVGVISHVEALKERIPLQIKVIPNGDGTSYILTN